MATSINFFYIFAITCAFSCVEGLLDVIIYSCADEPRKKNRGFAFLEYDTHKNASTAKRKLGNGRTKVWGCDILVDWADPLEEPDSDTMQKVRIKSVGSLYLRG